MSAFAAGAGAAGPWSAEQLEWLEALGHVPDRLAGPPPDALRDALVRAAGRDPADPRAARVLSGLPPVSALRGDAAAKRRLWPRLRALRAQAR